MMLNWLSKSALRRLNRAARRGRRPTPRPPLGAQPLEERAVPVVPHEVEEYREQFDDVTIAVEHGIAQLLTKTRRA